MYLAALCLSVGASSLAFGPLLLPDVYVNWMFTEELSGRVNPQSPTIRLFCTAGIVARSDFSGLHVQFNGVSDCILFSDKILSEGHLRKFAARPVLSTVLVILFRTSLRSSLFGIKHSRS
jgi:hypothetical protein